MNIGITWLDADHILILFFYMISGKATRFLCSILVHCSWKMHRHSVNVEYSTIDLEPDIHLGNRVQSRRRRLLTKNKG